MKRSIFVCTATLLMVSGYINAQKKEANPAKPLPPVGQIIASPPPPPPPPAPLPPQDETVIVTREGNVVPPVPPLPPDPPVPPVIEKPEYHSHYINAKGYEISIHLEKGEEMVGLSKDGKIQMIKMKDWIRDRHIYEKKYGKLLPPPLPPAGKQQ